MTGLLISFIVGAGPDPALLQKLSERAVALEAFAKNARSTVSVVVEKFDADGKVIETTRSTLRVGRTNGKVERKLVSFEEDGKDLTEKKRAELESAEHNERDVKSPFHPDVAAKYAFTVLDAPADRPNRVRIGFRPAGEKTSELYMGEATVVPETGDVESFSLRPSKNPAFVDSLFIEGTAGAPTPAGSALKTLSIRGSAGLLFFKQRFRIVSTFSDYEPL